ncbi:MAG: hypothetical protein J1F64_02235 [Oscillospiraceae bacterium]|nr:hypothetical protein [Oscillospiraceae bacterium]
MERYGTIPDKYTREWWDYIWYYYKWHILGTAFALFFAAVTIGQCALRINYDAEINYVGNEYYGDTAAVDKICEELSGIVEDVNGNGKNQVYFRQITVAKEGTPESMTEYNSGMLTKVALELQTGDGYLYLLSSQELDRLTGRDTDEIVFANPEEYLSDISRFEETAMQNGIPCAVKLSGKNKFLADHGLTKEPVYLAIRKIRERDKDKEDMIKKYDNAVRSAEYITSSEVGETE